MTTREMPAMASSTYANTVVDVGSLNWPEATHDLQRRLQSPVPPPATWKSSTVIKPAKEEPMALRLVQVFIADTNENLPLDKRVIYKGEQIATDLTDQELFFEIDIMSLLKKHNAERIKYHDKKVKERTEPLEPARIRDLKMNVVTIATF